LLWIGRGYAVRTVLRICDVARSTYYYRLRQPQQRERSNGGRPIPGFSRDKLGKKVADARIKACIRRLLAREEESVYGYRKLTIALRRQYGFVINKKKVYRLCKELHLLQPQREQKNRVPRRVANNRIVTGPNQLWQLDIKYGYVAGLRRHFFLASAIDVFDRSIVGHCRGRTCTTSNITNMLQQALLKRNVFAEGANLVIRTDNGPQFISKAFHAFCTDMHIEHERTPNRTPNKNAYIESFHSVLERECYGRHLFETYEQAFRTLDRYLIFYNQRRLHGSLGDLSPSRYLQKYRNGELTPQEIAL
jgi:putative transposase